MNEKDLAVHMQIEYAENNLANKLLVAFTAEVGCKPSEAEIVRQIKDNGDVVIFIRKRDSSVIQMPLRSVP